MTKPEARGGIPRALLRTAVVGACVLAPFLARESLAAAEIPLSPADPVTAAPAAWVEPTPLRPFAGPVIHLGSAASMMPRAIVTPTPLRPFLGPEIHFIP